MKKLLITAFAALTCLTASAALKDIGIKALKRTQKYTKDPATGKGHGFELLNKSKKILALIIVNDGKIVAQKLSPRGLDKVTSTPLTPISAISADIDIDKPTLLAVYEEWGSTGLPQGAEYQKMDTTDRSITTSIRYENGQFKPLSPAKIYSFPTGKTIYLTWDKTGFARPQTGVSKGIFKKTDSGWSLKNNVTKEDIKQVLAKA